MIEDTTIWRAGQCAVCGAGTHTPDEGGEYCDGCARRVERWRDG